MERSVSADELKGVYHYRRQPQNPYFHSQNIAVSSDAGGRKQVGTVLANGISHRTYISEEQRQQSFSRRTIGRPDIASDSDSDNGSNEALYDGYTVLQARHRKCGALMEREDFDDSESDSDEDEGAEKEPASLPSLTSHSRRAFAGLSIRNFQRYDSKDRRRSSGRLPKRSSNKHNDSTARGSRNRFSARGMSENLDRSDSNNGRKKNQSVWRKFRSAFRSKASHAKASLHIDRRTFSKIIGKRETEARPAKSTTLEEEVQKKDVKTKDTTSDDNGLRNTSLSSTGSKKQKKKNGMTGLRGLHRRVFSSPPTFSGHSEKVNSDENPIKLKGRFSQLGKRKELGDEVNLGDVRPSSSSEQAAPPLFTRSLSASSSGFPALRSSYTGLGYSMGVITPGRVIQNAPPDKNAANFKQTLEKAMQNKVEFKELLDVAFVLEERLSPDIKQLLIKYLTKHDSMVKMIDCLTLVVPNMPDDPIVEPMEFRSSRERVRYRYSYVASTLLTKGPIQLRRTLFLNASYLDRVVAILGVGTPSDPIAARAVCKVLLSALKDSPEDTLQAMLRRRDFLDVLLSHIAITECPEICLLMLSEVRNQAELKFGPPNRQTVRLMARLNIHKILCHKIITSAESGPIDGVKSFIIENCLRVMVGIALRALIVPRLDVKVDTDDAKSIERNETECEHFESASSPNSSIYEFTNASNNFGITNTESKEQFNQDLASLDFFENPEPVMHLIDCGLQGLSSYDVRGYALATALTAVRYIFVTAINGQSSMTPPIRTQVLRVSTRRYEEEIARRLPALARVLQVGRPNSRATTMWETVRGPLGMVRLKILELLVILQQHSDTICAKRMIDCHIPSIILSLFKKFRLNNVCLHFAATLIEQAFYRRSESGRAMRRSFLIECHIIDEVMHLWVLGNRKEKTRGRTPVADQGELMRICQAVQSFLRLDTEEVQRFKEEIGARKITAFVTFCEGEIAERAGLEEKLLGGVEQLPAREEEGLSFEELGGFGGSAGALY